VWIVVQPVYFAFALAYGLTLGWHFWYMRKQEWAFGECSVEKLLWFIVIIDRANI
jgi:hypothetical protein